MGSNLAWFPTVVLYIQDNQSKNTIKKSDERARNNLSWQHLGHIWFVSRNWGPKWQFCLWLCIHSQFYIMSCPALVLLSSVACHYLLIPSSVASVCDLLGFFFKTFCCYLTCIAFFPRYFLSIVPLPSNQGTRHLKYMGVFSPLIWKRIIFTAQYTK